MSYERAVQEVQRYCSRRRYGGVFQCHRDPVARTVNIVWTISKPDGRGGVTSYAFNKEISQNVLRETPAIKDVVGEELRMRFLVQDIAAEYGYTDPNERAPRLVIQHVYQVSHDLQAEQMT